MWFKYDDEAWMSDKLQRLSPEAGWLWVNLGSRCGHDATEGRVTVTIERQVRALFGLPETATAELVDAGHLHDSTTIRRCPTCKLIPPQLEDGKLKPGEFYFHDWLDYQFTRNESLLPEARRKAVRKKKLSNNSDLREQIYERDRGLCRYCGVRVNWLARRGDLRGTHDHVDPDGPNTLDNCVTCCGKCNQEKGNRTPEEWGRALLAPGQKPAETGTEPERAESGIGQAIRTRTREVGSGQVGGQSWTDPDRVPATNGNGNGHR